MSSEPTPVRRLGTRTFEGWIRLAEGTSAPEAGFESALFEKVAAAPDVSFKSDSLVADTEVWSERLHLDPARANILRGFAIPADARVLEIGAGGGVITRYLGETGATVDALEPSPAQARIARERCRDLPHVEVFVGNLSDVPSKNAYDIIIFTSTTTSSVTFDDSRAFLEFLKACAARLLPRGSLIVATPNKLGVKYLVGSPDEHTARVFDSIESYPNGSASRAWSRQELESLFQQAGLVPQTFAALPDHLTARMVASPESFPEDFRHLLHRIPDFPSPDRFESRPHLADEHLAWTSLVEAGLATDTANSFVIVAGKGQVAQLWPKNVAASYFSLGRRPIWSTMTRIRVSGRSLSFESARLYPKDVEPPLTQLGYREPAFAGVDLVQLCRDGDDASIEATLRAWSQLVTTRLATDSAIALDLVPHNTMVQPDGTLAVFDEEWFIERGAFVDPDHVRRRGVLWLAARVLQDSLSKHVQSQTTVRELAIRYGAMVGLPADDSWLESTLDTESRFQALVYPRPSRLTPDEWRLEYLSSLTAMVDEPLASEASDERDFETLARLRRNLGSMADRLRGPGLSSQNEDLALLVGLRVYSRIARTLLPSNSRRNRVANWLAARLPGIK